YDLIRCWSMPFRDVVGHRSLIALLARSAEHGSLPPSLIFAGPSGVGKHLLAVATAQALNCLRPCRPGAATKEGPAQSTFDSCCTCPASSRIARGGHADAQLMALSADGSVGRALEAGDLIGCRDVAARVLSHAAASNDPRRRIEGAKDLLAGTGAGGAGDREQLAAHLRAMASLLRDVELLGAHADAAALANADFHTGLDRLSAFQGER